MSKEHTQIEPNFNALLSEGEIRLLCWISKKTDLFVNYSESISYFIPLLFESSMTS